MLVEAEARGLPAPDQSPSTDAEHLRSIGLADLVIPDGFKHFSLIRRQPFDCFVQFDPFCKSRRVVRNISRVHHRNRGVIRIRMISGIRLIQDRRPVAAAMPANHLVQFSANLQRGQPIKVSR